ncbi:hypothetical protein [Luteipulveratus flavus]|uniref:Uncharacterized protein n=1 Tax=Luteipulveratus flavus TaxID=3031728 RepID=A0ABT6CDF9_9MICO|nr:hypothetical protein [Luteipulveratus sp. YIM 133296]MDF8265316.1 hypothetical protein [Luteipulveratus sp. YIM 133296]
MSQVAVLLLAVAVADLLRARRPTSTRAPIVAALATIVVTALLTHLTRWPDLLLLAGCALVASAWVGLAARSEREHRHEIRPLLVLGGGVVVLLLLAGAGSTAGGALGRWLHWVDLPHLQDVGPERFLLVLAVALVQLSTANQLVRLVLASVGALKPSGQPQPADRLRGGRLLGPMERLFILCLGLAGEAAAAGLVIAAKGLIRFPELNARRAAPQQQSEVGIDEVTEYLLVGSFVSWLISLAGLALAALA